MAILSATGQLMQHSPVPANVTAPELRLNKIPPGIYFIRIDLVDASSSTSKIVVN